MDWAAKAAAWAQQQAAKPPPPPPPPPPQEFQDIVENETEMEDAMPNDVSQSNEWYFCQRINQQFKNTKNTLAINRDLYNEH